MRYVLIRGALFSLCIAALSACSVNETATVSPEADGWAQVIESNSDILGASLRIDDTKVSRVGGLLRVQATIKNESRSTLSFKYKFKWMDQDGFEIAVSGRPWVPVVITGYESVAAQAVAPNESAHSFVILVQD